MTKFEQLEEKYLAIKTVVHHFPAFDWEIVSTGVGQYDLKATVLGEKIRIEHRVNHTWGDGTKGPAWFSSGGMPHKTPVLPVALEIKPIVKENREAIEWLYHALFEEGA